MRRVGRLVVATAMTFVACAGCAPRPHPVVLGAELYRHGAYERAWEALSRALDLEMHPPRTPLPPPGPPGGVAVAPTVSTVSPSALPRVAVPRSLVPRRNAPQHAGPRRVEGTVRSIEGDVAVLQVTADHTVRVDLSELALPIETLFVAGRTLAVWGNWTETALVVRGVALEYAHDRSP